MFSSSQMKMANRPYKKRNFLEMLSQPKLENSENLFDEIPHENKKKKVISNIDDIEREIEQLNRLQQEMKNLRLRCFSNENIKRNEIILKNNQENPVISYDIDMPEIIDMPIKEEIKSILNRSYYVDDDADTSNTSCNFESETPFREERINEKIIDNAIKTEKTMRKYFQDNFNPKLQPNESNGIILYNDMEKLKTKIDRDLLANYIVESYNQKRRLRHLQKMGMEIDSVEIIPNEDDFFQSLNHPELEIEFDNIVNNNEFFYYDMYLD